MPLHWVTVLTGRITHNFHELFHSGYLATRCSRTEAGGSFFLFFFGYCKMCVSFICLLPAKQALQAIHHYSLFCAVLKM